MLKYSFKKICNVHISTPAHRLEIAENFFYPNFGRPYFSSSSFLKKSGVAQSAGRAWWWQKCSELAYFQTAPPNFSLRSQYVNLTWHRRFCEELFGEV